MKNLIFFGLLFSACSLTNASDDQAFIYDAIELDTSIQNIQNMIKNAFNEGIMNGDVKPLEKVYAELEILNAKNPQNILSYWMSYSDYYASITAMQKKDSDVAEKYIDRAIDRMKDIENKNSEDYALLAMCQGFGIQFKGMQAMFISGVIKKNIKKAIDLDPENLRAQYVGGSNDFYTPERYGGGKKVEEYLTLALTLKDQKMINSYLPSWGRAEAYDVLISFYIKKEEWQKAKTVFIDANTQYPDNFTINRHAPKLINK